MWIQIHKFKFFSYSTTITKQVIQLILIMLVGTDAYVGDHMTVSHADAGYRTDCVNTAQAKQQNRFVTPKILHSEKLTNSFNSLMT